MWSGLIGGKTTLATATMDINKVCKGSTPCMCVIPDPWNMILRLSLLYIFFFVPVVSIASEHGFGIVSFAHGIFALLMKHELRVIAGGGEGSNTYVDGHNMFAKTRRYQQNLHGAVRLY